MKVAYLTLFQFENNNGKHARLNDIFDTLPKYDTNFEYKIFPLINDSGKISLSSLGFDATDMWGSRWHNLEAALSFRGCLNDIISYGPDVLHVGTSRRAETLLAKIVSMKLDIPVVFGPNIGGWYPMRISKYWDGGLKKVFSNWSDYVSNASALHINNPENVFAFSEYHKLMIRSIWGHDERITILPPAVHERFHRDQCISRDIDLLYVGDLSRQKGYNSFIKLLNNIDGDRELRVDIIGGEPNKKPVFNTIDIRYHGFIPRNNLPQYYNRSKLFICLSSDEMGPNTLIEAFSCGTPALVNDEVGLREYAKNGNAVFCDRDCPSDAAIALSEALDNIDELINNAERASSRYDMSITFDRLTEVYRDVL
ncbi:glycosyltransferase family 4 protein [Haloarcula japonica]|uniref:glycosyltransferase family 4 protein n=1 Tax=Haloarcula japonica TaxID=29282 RepID=UPI0039F65DE6